MLAELAEKLLAGVLLNSLGSPLGASRTHLEVTHRSSVSLPGKPAGVSTQPAGKLSVGVLLNSLDSC